MIEDSAKTSREMFLEELKNSYDKVWDVKATLESKANNIMTIAGAVATLLFGFGALFLKNLHPDYQFFLVFVILLVAGILASVAAIILCSLSFRLQKYKLAIGPDFFTDKESLIEGYPK